MLCIALAVAYGLIFLRDREVQRRIEIRPDCMIIEGVDTFWKQNMQLGWPGFMPTDASHFVLCGVYGSRWIEYLSFRRFDENDRAPELFATQPFECRLAGCGSGQYRTPGCFVQPSNRSLGHRGIRSRMRVPAIC